MSNQKLFTLNEISEEYGLPLSTLRRWAAERKFPIYKVSNRIRVSVDEWEDWLEQRHYNGPSSKQNTEVK